MAGLKIFLLAIHASNTPDVKSINAETVNCFADAMSSADGICMNVRRTRCRQVGSYLHWVYTHKNTDRDYSLQLPNFKRTAPQIPHVWSAEEIDKILSVIDTASPVGRRNYAIFLLLARTGLRISDVVGLKFSNIDWKNNCITLAQQKTGNALSLPFSKELGIAIISYLQDGRPHSLSEYLFLSHNAPF
jgi:integrase